MPARGKVDTDSIPSTIRLWMLEHPGEHRARDIAEGLGVPDGRTRAWWSQRIARALVRMNNTGKVVRHDRQLEGWKHPVGFYRLPNHPID